LRKSFSLLFTLIFIIIMAMVGVMILQFGASSTKHMARSFMDTKAQLALRAATEFAIMAIQGHEYNSSNTNGNRIQKINMNIGNEFNAEVRFHYFTNSCSSGDTDCSYADTNDTNMTCLIYVTVTSKNSDFNIRKVRTTLQNP